jgi:hypothetical protein
VKELQIEDAQIYLQNRPNIVIPLSEVEAAYNTGDPRILFEKFKVADIMTKMKEPFLDSDRGNPNPQNPNLLVERFNMQMQIFSYRNSDFKGLFNWLNGKFSNIKSVGELFTSKQKPGLRVSKAKLIKEFHEA